MRTEKTSERVATQTLTERPNHRFPNLTFRHSSLTDTPFCWSVEANLKSEIGPFGLSWKVDVRQKSKKMVENGAPAGAPADEEVI